VPIAGDEALRIEPLASRHDRAGFESGVEPLDRYFRTQAGQDARKNMAAPFVLLLPDGGVAGYYTLSSTSVRLAELPALTVRKLPRYPLVPATLLGRLAVDRRQQGKGYGRFLLADALYRAARSEIASFAVIVDAKDDNARRFYERESFLPLPEQPMRLFRPMADIAKLLE
jgi:GNAT superfamily N-acetyltransferase